MISTRVRAFLHSKSRVDSFPHCEKTQLLVDVRLFSSSLEDKQSFTASYLVNLCGVSFESAKSLSNKVHFENTKNPDSVLSLLRSYGFTNIHITKLVTKFPQVLNGNAEKTLKPKLDFFSSIGISSNDLVKFVSFDPFVLKPSLSNGLIPLYGSLKNIIGSDEKVIKILLRLAKYSYFDVQKNFAPNIAILKQLGAKESKMFAILDSLSHVMFRDRHRFEEGVNQICSLGYDPKREDFDDVMKLYFCLSKSTREQKMEIYKRWGWSEDDLDILLKNHPQALLHSEKKISNTMDFLVNKMGWKYVDIARCPTILNCSLEIRVIPRCLIYKVLLLKGLLKEELSLSTLLTCSLKKFEEKFVTRYEKQVPQLLEVYQGKISPLELGYTSEDLYGFKPSL